MSSNELRNQLNQIGSAEHWLIFFFQGVKMFSVILLKALTLNHRNGAKKSNSVIH